MSISNVRSHDQPCWTVVLCFSKTTGALLDCVWQTCLPKQRQAEGLKWIRWQASKRHFIPAPAFVCFVYFVVNTFLRSGLRPGCVRRCSSPSMAIVFLSLFFAALRLCARMFLKTAAATHRLRCGWDSASNDTHG
jgi:hypothetical protein